MTLFNIGKNINLTLVIAFIVISTISLKTTAKDIELRGLLIDNTITWFGQDFFFHFERTWRNQGFRGDQVFVEEIPSARKGSTITITFRGKTVYRTVINGTRASSRERGSQAVELVLTQIQNIEIASFNNNDIDLAADEI